MGGDGSHLCDDIWQAQLDTLLEYRHPLTHPNRRSGKLPRAAWQGHTLWMAKCVCLWTLEITVLLWNDASHRFRDLMARCVVLIYRLQGMADQVVRRGHEARSFGAMHRRACAFTRQQLVVIFLMHTFSIETHLLFLRVLRSVVIVTSWPMKGASSRAERRDGGGFHNSRGSGPRPASLWGSA